MAAAQDQASSGAPREDQTPTASAGPGGAWISDCDLLALLDDLGVGSGDPDGDHDAVPAAEPEAAEAGAAAGDDGGGGWSTARIAGHLAAGPGLAALLDGAAPAAASDWELPGIAASFRRVASWAQAGELAAVAQIASRAAAANPRVGAGEDGRPRYVPPEAAAQVALALQMSQPAASEWVSLAMQMRWRLPVTGTALATGAIDLPRARIIADGTRVLPDELAGTVEDRVLPGAAEQTAGQLRGAVLRAVIAADPDGAEQRRKDTERRARISLYPDEHGTATLTGSSLPGVHAAAAMARISAMARAMKSAGAGGGLDLLRAHIYLGLLLGTMPLIPPPPGDPSPGDGSPGGCSPGDPAAGDGSGFGNPPDDAGPSNTPPGNTRPGDGSPADPPAGDMPDDPSAGDPTPGDDPGGSPASDAYIDAPADGPRTCDGSDGRSAHDSPSQPPASDSSGNSPHNPPADGTLADGPPADGTDSSRSADRPESSAPASAATRHQPDCPGGADCPPTPWQDIPPPSDQDAPPYADSDPASIALEFPCGEDSEEDDTADLPSPDWPALPVRLPAAGLPPRSPAGSARPQVGLLDVLISWSALAGWSSEPGRLGRIGPVTGLQARQLLILAARSPGTEWRVVVTDDDGHAIAVERARPGWQARCREDERDVTGDETDTTGVVGRVTVAIRESWLGTPRTSRVDGPWPVSEIGTIVLRAAARAAARAGVGAGASTSGGGCAHTMASPSYRPPPRIREFVAARDVTCRFATCGQPAWRTDLDHTVPWHNGGPTCPCNLGGCCRTHHKIKQLPGWHLEQPRPGVFGWTTPAGRSYLVQPDQYPA